MEVKVKQSQCAPLNSW